jgi:hypothetical protein
MTGVRELWWDPGSVISQDLIQFKTGHLFLIIIDDFLYLCLPGWSTWKHMVQLFKHPRL